MDAFELVAKIKMDLSEYEAGLDKASSEASGFGSKLKNGLGTAAKVGAAAVTAVTAASVALGKSLVSNAAQIAAEGDNIDKMSQKMGMSAKAYQEWDAVMQHSGTSMETMKASMKTLANAAMSNNEAFKKLGITEKELKSLNQEQLFEKTIAQLQNVEDTTQRTYLAGKLLGRGATELGALLNTSAEETQKMRDRVHELGGVMSDEAVKASAKFQDNLQDLKTALGGLKKQLLSDTVPAFNDLMEGFTSLLIGEEGADEAINRGMEKLNTAIGEIMPKLGKMLETILPKVLELGGTLVTKLAEQVPGIIEAIAKQIPTILKQLITTAKKVMPELLKVGMNILKSIADGMKDGKSELLDMIIDFFMTWQEAAIDNLPLLLDIGLQILESLIEGILNNLPKIADAVFKIIEKLGMTIIEKLPEILEKGKDILMKIVQGITENLPKIVQAAVEVIKKLAKALIDNLPEILQAGVQLLLELAKGIFEALPDLLGQIPQLIMDLVGALLDPENLGKILDAGFQMIGQLFEGLFSGDFLGAAWDVIEALIAGVGAAMGAVLELGAKIVGWILDGIKGAWDGLVGWVEKGIENLLGDVNAARDAALATYDEINSMYEGKIKQNEYNYKKYGSAYGITGQESFASSNSAAAIAQQQGTKKTPSGSSDASNFAGSQYYVNLYMKDSEFSNKQQTAKDMAYTQAALKGN